MTVSKTIVTEDAFVLSRFSYPTYIINNNNNKAFLFPTTL